MRTKTYHFAIKFFLICLGMLCTPLYAGNKTKPTLEEMYIRACGQPSDINEHVPILRELAKECSSVVEIGIIGKVSTWGILQGLSKNGLPNRTYLGIDINLPWGTIAKAEELAEENGIAFKFWQENDLNILIPPTDLLFIDSTHTYCHLTYELEKFSPYVSKYIAMHDTSDPWGNYNDPAYQGDYTEYPDWYNRNKQGLWPAIEDFLETHPEWILRERLFNNHGFTILERVAKESDDTPQGAPTISGRYDFYRQNNDRDAPTHLPKISQLAKECSYVTEIGVKSMALSWGILKGLSESQSQQPNYLGIGINAKGFLKELLLARSLCQKSGIDFSFWPANDLYIQIEPTDMLVLNTFHTYCHLTYELESFTKNVGRYICIFYSYETEDACNDPKYLGDYSEYPSKYDKTKKGVWPAIKEFLDKHPEWALQERLNGNVKLTILKRCSDNDLNSRMNDPVVQNYLHNKMILCTGPSLNRYNMLKENTEADLNLIKFKKIFVSTNDPQILSITFNKRKPDGCILLDNWGKQLDCLNCIITTLKAAVNDPEVLDDDIMMFKHETVFLNDMGLVKRIIKKMIDGPDLIIRTGVFGPCTDHFYAKVSAIKTLVRDYPLVTHIPYSCEESFRHIIVNQLTKVYNLSFRHSLWRFTQLGAYHIYPGHGKYDAETDGWNSPWWNKNNYDELFK